MSSIDDTFSEENLLAYSGACLDLAVSIPEKRKIKGFDTLVIPSRGAVPFFFGLQYALKDLGKVSQEHQDFYDTLEVSPLLPDLESSLRSPAYRKSQSETKVLLVPFTADLNVEKLDSSESNDEYTKKTREYWANVTAAFFRPPAHRKRDRYFASFIDIVLRRIELREDIARFYENFPQIERFALIDTVISGRASNDILKAFDRLAVQEKTDRLQPHTFLIVDENGGRLKRLFASYLNRKKLSGQVELIHIPKIVSEDKGASLLGVCAVIYPTVMKESKNIFYGGEEFFVGAGSWYSASNLGHGNQYLDTFNRFMKVIFKGIDLRFSQDYIADVESRKLETFRNARQDFVNYLTAKRIMAHNDADVSVLNLNGRYKTVEPYETTSHVVHIPFDNDSNSDILIRIHSLNPFMSYKPKTK